nr:hypothetical protein [Porphyromonas gingivalis]
MLRLRFVNSRKHARDFFRFGSGNKKFTRQSEIFLAPRF